jgi:hypothetical protein
MALSYGRRHPATFKLLQNQAALFFAVAQGGSPNAYPPSGFQREFMAELFKTRLDKRLKVSELYRVELEGTCTKTHN